MKKLLVVWKSEHPVDIEKFIVPFTYNSKEQGWFDSVELLIWGASQLSVKNNESYQQHVKTLVHNGIEVYACKMCADATDATSTLELLGVKVEYTGTYLAERLNSEEWEVITL